VPAKRSSLSQLKIFLIGLPGSGKSTLGKELAKSLTISFVDLDTEIEKETGKKISVIFNEFGEDFFRKLESGHLRKWTGSTTSFVMATGGGTPCFVDNMNLINRSGKSFFLDVPVREIVRRIRDTPGSERPLLDVDHPDALKKKIELMRSGRMGFYNRAHVVLSDEQITVEKIKEKLIF
jgi:shikimate kinase